MKKHLIMMLSLFSVIPLLLFGIFSMYTTQKSVTSHTTEMGMANVKEINSQIQTLIDKDLDVLRLLAANPVVRDYKNKDLQKDIKPILVDGSKIVPELLPIILDAPNGQQLVKSDDTAVASVADRDYYKAVTGGKDSAVSDVLTSKGNGHPIIVLAVPVKDPATKQLLGLMQGTIDLVKLTEFVSKFSTDNGTAFVLDKQGKVIAHPKQDMNTKDLGKEPYVQNGLKGNDGISIIDANGTKMFTAAMLHKETGWLVVYQKPYAQVMQESTQMLLVSVGVLIAALIVSILAGYFFAARMTKPIRKLAEASQQIADGNLRVTVDIKDKNEIGVLAASFNTMIQHLKSIVQQVGAGSEQVAATAEQLTASAEQTSRATEQVAVTVQEVATGSEQQVQNVEQSAKAVKEMSVGVKQIAEHAHSVSDSAAQASDVAQDGTEAIQKAIQQMHSISETVDGLSQVIKELGDRSQAIGQIVEVITNIAGQTNLLALNAAIEAARAGEHGRGFAVVADEVRKLAEQSSESAQQIADLIKSIQAETDKAVGSMETATSEVANGIEVVTSAGQSFRQISNSVHTVTEQIQEVSAASQQMSAGTEQVVSSIEYITEVSAQTAMGTQTVSAAAEEQLASMEEITASANSLSKMAEDLQGLVRKFQV